MSTKRKIHSDISRYASLFAVPIHTCEEAKRQEYISYYIHISRHYKKEKKNNPQTTPHNAVQSMEESYDFAKTSNQHAVLSSQSFLATLLENTFAGCNICLLM